MPPRPVTKKEKGREIAAPHENAGGSSNTQTDLTNKKETAPSICPIDWQALTASVREATSSVSSNGTSQSRETMMEFLPYLSEIAKIILLYASALYCDQNCQENLCDTNNGKDDTGGGLSPKIDKNLILDTRRALRFTLSLLSFGRIYDDYINNKNDDEQEIEGQMKSLTAIIQEEAIVSGHCRLHRSLCQLISEQNADGKCRLFASRLLCNLVTANFSTSNVLVEDVACSPSDTIVSERMLNLMRLSDYNEREDDKQDGDECVSSGLNWVDMISASARAGQREAVAAIAAALHNCIVSLEVEFRDKQKEGNSIDENTKETGLSLCLSFATSLASDTALVCNMLRHMLPSDAVKSSIDSSVPTDEKNTIDKGEGDSDERKGHADAATEWISLVLERLCGLGLLPQMYRAAGGSTRNCDDIANQDLSSDATTRRLIVTPEQVVLLHCIGRSVEEGMHVATTNTTSFSSPQKLFGGNVSDDAIVSTFRFLAEEVGSIRSALFYLVDGGCGTKPEKTIAVLKERYDGEVVCGQDAQMTLLEMLATALSHDGADSRNSASTSGTCITAKIRELLGRETPLLTSALLDLGQLVDKLSTKNRGRKARELFMENEEQRLVTVLVRLIGNLCYRCRFNQDLVRITEVPVSGDIFDSVTMNKNDNDNLETKDDASISKDTNQDTIRNGLHIILSCTSFAYGCFTLREWALVAIRNILEDNEENRNVVEHLEAQKAIDTPELQKMGIKVDLDRRGNVHVVHDKDSKTRKDQGDGNDS